MKAHQRGRRVDRTAEGGDRGVAAAHGERRRIGGALPHHDACIRSTARCSHLDRTGDGQAAPGEVEQNVGARERAADRESVAEHIRARVEDVVAWDAERLRIDTGSVMALRVRRWIDAAADTRGHGKSHERVTNRCRELAAGRALARSRGQHRGTTGRDVVDRALEAHRRAIGAVAADHRRAVHPQG